MRSGYTAAAGIDRPVGVVGTLVEDCRPAVGVVDRWVGRRSRFVGTGSRALVGLNSPIDRSGKGRVL